MKTLKQCYVIVFCGVMGAFLLNVFGNTAVVVAQEEQTTAASQSETDVPVFMDGDSFKTNLKEGTYTLIGNARFIRGNDSVFCDTLTIYMTPERQVTQATAEGNVRILTRDVTATGEQGIFYLDEQKVELEGQAKAAQGNNTITGHRIIAWLEGSAIEGYGSKETERVIMTIYSEPVKQSAAADAPETGNAPETDETPPPSLIAIESDTLQYDESQEYAMFTGDVRARQDDMDIQSDEMRVFLAAAQESGSNNIDRIEVSGHVQIVQDNVIVTGEEGVFTETEQSAVITGSAEKQARAENSADRSVLNADSIKILLDTEDIQAEGNVSFETVLSESAPEATP